MDDKIANGLWGLEECEWSAVGSEGQSGELLSIWRKGVIVPYFSFKSKGFLGINASWKDINCYFVNVYSSCSLIEKRVLWNDLLEWKRKLPRGEWIVGGDFNSIRVAEERKGCGQSNRVDLEEFAKFIELMEVVDLPVIGNMFTWVNSNGKARRNRDISDHRPVWVKTSKLDWGPKPFKVFHCWYEHEDFLKFVKQEWEAFSVTGSSAFVLKEKLKLLRNRLRWWHKHVFGWLDLKDEEEVDELNGLEEEAVDSTTQLSHEIQARRREVQANIWRDLRFKEKEVGEIRKEVKEYFEKRFNKDDSPRPRLVGIEFNRLSVIESAELEEEFSMEEIREVVFSCEGDRSPGPDGFNLEFIKRSW
ncbi:uncharacterized protein LOC131633261 [Vicia villosa]|uniref:uncharacterized protein LOC131633261 n=1 Tax=Vicia villosa TaxID=3911 RepID=UPI00273CBF17|nr:uncharacterized protein LOC131633261 [Vicia villosa]